MIPIRLLRRAVMLPAVVLTVALAVLAVLVARQTEPTETAAVAAGRVERAMAEVATAAGLTGGLVVGPGERAADAPCTWFGLTAMAATGQVRPARHLTGRLPGADPVAPLDAAARLLGTGGWAIVRTGGLVEATAPDGSRISAAAADGQLRLDGVAPCVWPGGVREPAP
jgi:hypothetical protein